MEKPFSAYLGDGPYVFVCYAHEDSEIVFHEIAWLNDYGANVWYDEGISPGQEWSDELAKAIQGCTKVLYFVTSNSVSTEHCRRELNFAQEEGREAVAIHLEATEVPAGLRLVLNNRQAILKYELSEEEFHKRLMRAVHGDAVSQIAPTPTYVEKAPRRKMSVTLAAIALLSIAVGAWWLLTRESDPEKIDIASVAEVKPAPTQEMLRNSVAVLPFENLSPDPNNAYFAAGIHEEVLNQLAKIRDLSVIARTTMVRYAGSPLSVPEIGRELRVQTVMEGSVRYAGDRVRITAQLIDAQSGAHLWSEAYEESLQDIFGIQLAIATRIANTLEAEFSATERKRVGTRLTDNSDAYSLYLRAMANWGSFSATEPILADLDAAIDLDPSFAAALAFKAWILNISQIPRFLTPRATAATQLQTFVAAKRLAEQALAIDELQARAHYVLNGINMFNRRWAEALSGSDRAFELNPSDYVVTNLHGLTVAWSGNVDEGLRLLRRSVEINPADVANIWQVGEIAYLLRRWTDAKREATAVISKAPDAAFGYALLAKANARLGDVEQARANAVLAEARTPGLYELVDIAMAYRNIGDGTSARRIFELARAGRPEEIPNPDWQFWMHMSVGKIEAALQFLAQVVDGNFPLLAAVNLHYHADHPDYDPIRSDPSFSDLLRRMNAPLDDSEAL